MPYAVSRQCNLQMKIMDAMFLMLVDDQTNTKILVKLSQKTPDIQIQKLMKQSMYNTTCTFAEVLLENDFEKLTNQELT